TNCSFTGNAAVSGGAIYNESSSADVTSCSFTGNSANSSSGGAVLDELSTAHFTDCSFTANHAAFGSALEGYSSSTETLVRCSFIRNFTTYADAGAVFTDSSLAVTNCIFDGNIALKRGGALFSDSHASVTIVDCSVVGNSADFGGAIADDHSV